ncbi:MAG TPA: hypothetical protein VLE48_03740 [Terriglobales bacterium]|nr:hypothetical protein [Terriglobales bacterium]
MGVVEESEAKVSDESVSAKPQAQPRSALRVVVAILVILASLIFLLMSACFGFFFVADKSKEPGMLGIAVVFLGVFVGFVWVARQLLKTS